MQIHINARDKVRVYLQVVNQIRCFIASGRLTPDTELPSIRVLAEKLIVNPNTIARAYRELENMGLVEKRRTSGTYITNSGALRARSERVKLLTERIDQLLAQSELLAVSFAEVMQLMTQRYSIMTSQPPGDCSSE